MTGQQTTLKQYLEWAVLASWKQLMPSKTPVIARIDYHPGGDAPLEFIKVWASTERGYWNLVCDYWPQSSASRPVRPTFTHAYHSDRLLQALEAIPQHLPRFNSHDQGGRDGFILLQNVTPPQCDRAEQMLNGYMNAVLATSAASESVYADA